MFLSIGHLSAQNIANWLPSLLISSEPAVVLALASANKSVSSFVLKLTVSAGKASVAADQ